MAIANLNETLQAYILRRNALQVELSELGNQKTLATYAQADKNSELNQVKSGLRSEYKLLYENDEEYYESLGYHDYTELPDYQEAIQIAEAQFEDELAELTAWEAALDNQIKTDDVELQEINAYIQSYQSMLNTNITDDFNFGLN